MRRIPSLRIIGIRGLRLVISLGIHILSGLLRDWLCKSSSLLLTTLLLLLTTSTLLHAQMLNGLLKSFLTNLTFSISLGTDLIDCISNGVEVHIRVRLILAGHSRFLSFACRTTRAIRSWQIRDRVCCSLAGGITTLIRHGDVAFRIITRHSRRKRDEQPLYSVQNYLPSSYMLAGLITCSKNSG